MKQVFRSAKKILLIGTAIHLVTSYLFPSPVIAKSFANRIVAIVGNEALLESDLEKIKTSLQNGSADENLFLDQKPEDIVKDRKKLVQYGINEKILEENIDRLKLRVTSEAVNDEIRNIAKQNGLKESQLYAQLAQNKISASEYQNTLKARLERNSLKQQEIIGRLRISDEDILSECFRTHPELNRKVQEVGLSSIFFNPSGKNDGIEGARNRAEEAYKKLRAGESFEKLAQAISEDEYLGDRSFKPGEMSPEFEAALQGLSPGQFSKPTKTQFGFHILKLSYRKDTRPPVCEKEKETLRSKLLAEAFEKQFKLWLEVKRANTYVHINEG